MRKRHSLTVLLLVALTVTNSACAVAMPELEPTPTATLRPTETSTPLPTDTATPRPTDTPTPAPTSTSIPTSTPTQPPTETPEPTGTPEAVAGWRRFEGNGIALWLPATYEGASLPEDVEIVLEALRLLGPEFEEIARMFEDDPTIVTLWAFEQEVGESGFLTNVSVTKERVPSFVTLNMYLDATTEHLPDWYRIVERDVVTVGDLEAGRLVLESLVYGEEVKQLVYAFPSGSTMWVVTYSTARDEFAERLPVFEQSAETFSIGD